jgi:mediator of RNA polymerase II transcription subunit 21
MPRLMKIPRNQPTAAPMPVIIGNPNNNPNLTTGDQSQSQTQTQADTSQQLQLQQSGAAGDPVGTGMTVPDSPRTFAARQRELARDLIIKEQQIEYLIARLPGIDSSEAEQEARIRELERELRGVEAERDTKARELRHLLRKLEGVMGAVQSGIFGHRD